MKYFQSIKTQLLLAIGISLFVFLLVAMGGLYLFQERELTRESIKKATEIGNVLKAGLKGQMVTRNTELLQTLADEIKAYKNITDIYIINADGVVKFSSDPAFTGVKLSKENEECRKCHHQATEGDTTTLKTRNSSGLSILRNVTHIYNEPACFQCHPSSQKNLGLLFVDYSTAGTNALILSTLVRLFFTAVIACIFISLIIFYIMNRLIHKPITMLIERTNEISSGNYQQQIRYEGSTEFNILNESFNDMSEKLRISRDHLEQRIQERTINLNISNQQLAREIVEHRKAEETLRESEENNRLLLQAASDGIFGVNTSGKVTFVNPAALHMLGFTSDEMLGQSVHKLIHHSHTDGSSYVLEDCPMYASYTYANTTIMISESLWRRDGSSFPVEYSSTPITKDGKVQGAVVIFKDITERKQAEEAIQQAATEWTTSFDAMPDGVSIHDVNYNILKVNRTLCQILGKSGQELIGKKCYSLFHGAANPITICSIEHAQETRKDQHEEFFETTLNKWLSVSSSPIFGSSGEVIRIVHVVRDITDRKRSEDEKQDLKEQLQRAEKMEALGQLAGGVAHDLNNVLGLLSGYSELLIDEVPDGSKSRGYAEKILKSTQKGAAIIDDLLTLARRGVTSSEVIHLNDVVSSFLVTPYFEGIKKYHPRVSFRTECDETLKNIKGSPVHLEKTLMNLVSNAAEAISGEGVVTIRTENRYLEKPIRSYDEINEGEYSVLIVSDTGAGIPAEDREKIFEPFYTKKKMGRSGTGLGLSIVWGTVKDHNGYIDLQSQEGEGTTFSLYFPVTGEELAALQEKMPIEQYMGRGESVLVVDDIPEQREIAANLLTKLGYEVRQAASGRDAMEYLKTNEADILVLDMIMPPGMDGLDTYKKILESRPKQKAIIVSGFSANERVKEAQRLGVAAYIKKPYVLENIGVAIRHELDKE